MTLGRLTSVAALAVTLAGAPILIAGAEEAHHPGTAATAQAQPATPTPAPGQMPMQPGQQGQMPMQPGQMPMQPGQQGQGMMGPGMMGQGGMGMMGQGGMMGGGMGMMGSGMMGPGMMGGGMMGSGMMGQGMMGGGMMGGGAMHGTARIEGRLAFVKAELAVTNAQEKVWGDFANAVRNEAKAMDALRKEAADKPAATPVERIDQYERHLTARLDSTRKIKAALTPLYATLSDAQKKTLSELHPMLRGMM